MLGTSHTAKRYESVATRRKLPSSPDIKTPVSAIRIWSVLAARTTLRNASPSSVADTLSAGPVLGVTLGKSIALYVGTVN